MMLKNKNILNTINKKHCKRCGKTVGSMGFCADCGTYVYVVQEKTHPKTSASKKHTKIIACEICGGKFGSKNGLLNHIKLKHPEFVIECRICTKQFTTEKSRIDHIKSKHSEHDEKRLPMEMVY